jgi:hypothetical protein
MIRNRALLKGIATFFILETIISTIAPTISWALTSGPTAPEATSFEPVDTTDLVNLNTGDLTYNIPLLEIPGPAGSYPIALSYHAGTQVEEEASWTGLGWSLNVGSVSRMVSGIADDYDGAKTTSRVFWEGGESSSKTFGLSYGIGNFATVGAGVTFAQDTYRGFGVGGYYSQGLSFGGRSAWGVGVTATASFGAYGGTSTSMGVGLQHAAKKANMSANIGVSINSDGNAGLGGGVNVGRTSAMDVSIGTAGNSNISAGGVNSSTARSVEGKISSKSDGFSVDIPVYYGINVHLASDYRRYWTDESETVENYGSLFFPSSSVSLDLKAFDSYHLPDVSTMVTGVDPAFANEGSFADYDIYSVNAQGLGGNFRPYHYTLSLYHQNITRNSGLEQVKGYYIPQHSKGVGYRFIGDFSNRVLNNPPDVEFNKVYTTQTQTPNEDDDNKRLWKDESNTTYTSNQIVPVYFPYGSPKTGIEGYEESGSKRVTPNVPGSKHIDYFTNSEIEAHKNDVTWLQQKGFIETTSLGFTRTDDVSQGKVGAFKITNSSGVTYHFSLPVYAYEECAYTQNKDVQNNTSFNNLTQKGRYAYTWLLTAITGPDYVDRSADGNSDGKLNEYDWGYWVSFEYGKWTSIYQWRTPVEGFRQDVDNDFETFSKGKKELYYLNSIRTKTHTALFVKQLRADGKGTTSKYDESVRTANHEIGWIDQGGFNVQWHFTNSQFPASVYEYPVGVLRLNKILLLKNDSNEIPASELYASGNHYNHFEKVVWNGQPSNGTPIHMGNNVFDVYDLQEHQDIIGKSVRVIDLDYDYSLCRNTPNSFDENGELYTYPYDDNLSTVKSGKLTLTSLSFKGRGGADLIPPLKFKYDIDDTPVSTTISSVDSEKKRVVVSSNTEIASYEKGDIVVFEKSNEQYYGFVSNKTGSTAVITIITQSLPTPGTINGLRRTKNPPYHKDMVDIWGNYKADYKNSENHNLDRFPTKVSSRGVDAWSLREIVTSTGAKIKIDYESDTYEKSIFSQNLCLSIAKCDPVNTIPLDPAASDAVYIEAKDPNLSHNFDEIYTVGDWVGVAFESYIKPLNLPQSMNIVTSAQVQLSEPGRVVLRAHLTDGGIFTTDPQGYLLLGSKNVNYGGGVRVRSIQVSDLMDKVTRATLYQYDFGNKSSGVTSYEPLNFFAGEFSSHLKTAILSRFTTLLSLSRELPPPGVYYGKIRVSESVQYEDMPSEILPSYSEYSFKSFTSDMLNSTKSNLVNQASAAGANTYDGITYGGLRKMKVSVDDRTQQLGAPQSVALFDRNGNKISETINHYLNDQQPFPFASITRAAEQGVIQETFNHARIVKKPVGTEGNVLTALISQKNFYPAVQTGTTTVDYKTGLKTRTQNLEYDFYSGRPVRVLSENELGNLYLTEVKPAYKIYPKMGLKIASNGTANTNAHMLEQVASNYIYRVSNSDITNLLGLVSATTQTWSDQISVLRPGESISSVSIQPNIWRKQASYSFKGDDAVNLVAGLYPLNSFNPFTSWSTSEPTQGWQKDNSITLYDVNSHLLEVNDISNQLTASRMSFDGSKVMASATNAGFEEFAYSNVEEKPDNEAFGSDVVQNSSEYAPIAHTGSKALSVQPGARAFTFSMAPKKRTYRVSVWSSQATCSFKYKFDSNNPQSAAVKNKGRAGNWYLLEADIPVTESLGRIEIWCEADASTTYFDDFRVHPVDASMTSYVYNAWDELTHILDNNNLYTEYRYDEIGRLKSTHRETFQTSYGNYGVAKTSETVYNYGVKNPFAITISASSSGTSGAISPVGETNILQGGSQVFAIAETCSSPKILRILIDNKPINITSTNTTLWDGTQVVYSNGQLLLKNVQSPHTLKAEFFTSLGGGGGVSCHYDENGCASGFYDYYIIDNCGDHVDRVDVPWSMIPAEFRPATRPTCQNIPGSECGTRN